MDDEDGVRHRRHRPYTDTQNDSYTYVDQDNYDHNYQHEEFDNIYHKEEFDNNDRDSQYFYDRRSSGGDHSRGSSSGGSLSEDVYRVNAGSSGSDTDLNLFNVSDSRSVSVSSESSMSDSAFT